MVTANERTIVARALTYRYEADASAVAVLDAVEFSVGPGEFVVLNGPSGAGKTTLLSLIGALRQVQAGVLVTLGKDLTKLSESERIVLRRNIGYIFQDHNLFDTLTPAETLRLTMTLQSKRYRRSDYLDLPAKLLGALGLGGKLHRFPAELSTGERQRVAIARALINTPRLILADEPTASLDAQSAAIAIEYLRRVVTEQGASLLMVSHDPRHNGIADRVLTLLDGRLTQMR